MRMECDCIYKRLLLPLCGCMDTYVYPCRNLLELFSLDVISRTPKGILLVNLRCLLFRLLNHVRLLMTLWTAGCQAPLSSTVSYSLLRFMSIMSMMLSNHLILCHPLLLLPSIFPIIRIFSKESALCIRWPKYWSFSISCSNEYSGLISFRID